MESRVIVCVGSPGNGRDIILEEMRKLYNFHYHHLFEYIVEKARLEDTNLTKLNILDFYDGSPERMEQYRKAAIETITKETEKYPGTHIVSTPLHFEWKGKNYQGLNNDEILRLNPDMIVIIFDDILRVRARLSQDKQWQDHKFTLGGIANWRREETTLAYYFTRLFEPRLEVQLVSYENGPQFLQDLIWSYGREKVYLSHPITGEGEGFLNAIYDFGQALSEHYVVFDPAFSKDWNIVEAWRIAVNEAIMKGEPRPNKLKFSMSYKDGLMEEEIESVEIETAIKNLRFQIVDTDYKIIENSSLVIVYHPRASISAGVICEMIYAKRLGKLVYAYYPFEPSLFFEWYATRIFTDEDELKEFLIKRPKDSGQMPLDVY